MKGPRGEEGRGGLEGRENKEEKGRVKPTNCSADAPPTKEARGEGNYPVHEDNLIQLSQHQPSKSAIYGSFLLAKSLYTKRKNQTHARDGERDADKRK